MTVSTPTAKKTYNGDGATVNFPTTFPFFVAADLVVTERVITTGVETLKVLTTDYTVTGGGSPVPATGTVVAVTAPAATVQWVLTRKLPGTQLVDYIENDPFPAQTHEGALDRLTLDAADRQEQTDRALTFPVSDGAASIGALPNSVDRLSKFLAFDAAGKPIAATTITTPPVSTFMATVLDDTTAAAARTTLGAIGLTANSFTGTQAWAKGADIASAAPLVLGADGNYFDVTGTTGFAAITVGAGTLFMLQFDGILTLTHHATNLDLPGEANITTAAGDSLIGYATAANQVHVLSYTKADGTAVVAATTTAASQAEQETGTELTKMVTPGRQHFHQSAAKFWVKFDPTGTIQLDYNVASITDNGVGDWTIVIDTDFSSANYAVAAMSFSSTSNAARNIHAKAQAAGTVNLICTTAGDVLTDNTNTLAVGFGDI